MFNLTKRLIRGGKIYFFDANKMPPELIDLEITGACNLKCPNCPRTYSKNKRGDMSDDLFFKIIASIVKDYPRLSRLSFHFFGELEMKNNFDSLIKLARQKLPYTHFGVSTTLSFKDKEIVRRVLLTKFTTIGVWLDSYSEESCNRIGSGRSFEVIKENLHFFLTEREKRQLNDPILHVGLLRDKLNQSHLEDFYHEFKFVENFKNAYLVAADTHDWAGQVPSDTVINTVKRYSYKIPKPCSSPCTTLAISATGDVTLCCYDAEFKLKIGNIKDKNGIKELWTSQEAQSLRNKMRFLKAPEMCQQCDHYYLKSLGPFNKERPKSSSQLLRKLRTNDQKAQRTRRVKSF